MCRSSLGVFFSFFFILDSGFLCKSFRADYCLIEKKKEEKGKDIDIVSFERNFIFYYPIKGRVCRELDDVLPPQPIVGLPNHLSGMSTPTSLSRLHKKLRRIWVRKFRKFEPIDRSLFFFSSRGGV